MGKNKTAREKLIELYGPECFIDKLHLRVDTTPRHYTSKKQMKKMKKLTYHHILEKRNGGKATVENGALLSMENHIWFNKQNPKLQAELNKKFQEYKKCCIEITDESIDEISPRILIAATEFISQPKYKSKNLPYDRNKMKRDTQTKIDKALSEYEK